MKTCSRCHTEKELNNFNKDSTKRDGFYPACRPCRGSKKRLEKTFHIDSCGYMAYGKNRIHRMIMEDFTGRPLRGDEYVHHINGDKIDNRIENLELVSPSEHSKHHFPEIKARFFTKKIHPSVCRVCGVSYHSSRKAGLSCSIKCNYTWHNRKKSEEKKLKANQLS